MFSHRSVAPRMQGEGKVLIRSHVIEASGSSEAWYVPPRLFARCGLARGEARLGVPGVGRVRSVAFWAS